MRREKEFQGAFDPEIWRVLAMAYAPYRGWILFFILCGWVGRGLLLANANVIGAWVDQGGANPVFFLWTLAAMGIAGFFATWVFRIGFSDCSAWAVSQFYDETTYRTSRLPMSFFDREPVGRIVTRFSSDYGNVFRLFGGPLAEFLSILFDLSLMLILTGLASPLFLPFILIMGGLQFWAYRRHRNSLRTQRRALSRSRSPAVAHFAETVQGSSQIRILRKETEFARQFAKKEDRYLNDRRALADHLFRYSFEMNLITASLLLGFGALAYWGLAQGWLSLGSLGVAFAFVSLSAHSLQMFFDWLTQFEDALVGVERMNEYMQMPIESGEALPAAATFATAHPKLMEKNSSAHTALTRPPMSKPKGAALQVENLHFRYSIESPLILRDISFAVKPCEKWGIVGRTGSGKSSLIQALFHLYPWDQGRYFIDGKDMLAWSQHPAKVYQDHTPLQLLRQQIALISQDPTLFRGTVRENIDMPGLATDEQIFAELTKVGVGPNDRLWDLDLLIAERGRNLSSGEKQLLCFARGLLSQAPILILDEATSQVDPQTEEAMKQATAKHLQDRTVLIVAHRLSTLEQCDQILWLNRGQVYRQGPAQQLLEEFARTDLGLIEDNL